MLPNLALWDQGAPPSAARTGPVTLAPAPHPSRHAGLPLRSARRPCGAAGVYPRQRATDGDAQELPVPRRQDDRAVQDLTEPGTAIDARQRSASSATGHAKAAPPRTSGTGQLPGTPQDEV